MKVDKKKEWDKGKTLHSKETKKKKGEKKENVLRKGGRVRKK